MENRKANAAILFSLMLTLAALLVALPAAQALAFGPGGGPGMRHGGGHGCGFAGGPGGFGLGAIMHKLDVTPDQKQQIAVILKAHLDESRQLFDKLAAAREKLFSAVHNTQYNEATVRQAAQELAPLQEERVVLRAKVVSEIQNVLTSEQKEKLTALRADMQSRMQERMEGRFDRLDGWINRHTK